MWDVQKRSILKSRLPQIEDQKTKNENMKIIFGCGRFYQFFNKVFKGKKNQDPLM